MINHITINWWKGKTATCWYFDLATRLLLPNPPLPAGDTCRTKYKVSKMFLKMCRLDVSEMWLGKRKHNWSSREKYKNFGRSWLCFRIRTLETASVLEPPRGQSCCDCLVMTTGNLVPPNKLGCFHLPWSGCIKVEFAIFMHLHPSPNWTLSTLYFATFCH